jgi:hypothetical protein
MRRNRSSAECTDSPAQSAASSSLSAYVHQNSEGDKPEGIADGHANTATSREDGQQRNPTYSQRSRLRTIRDASLYLIGLVALLMAFPMGASAFLILCLISLGASLIGIGSTLALWLKRKR